MRFFSAGSSMIIVMAFWIVIVCVICVGSCVGRNLENIFLSRGVLMSLRSMRCVVWSVLLKFVQCLHICVEGDVVVFGVFCLCVVLTDQVLSVLDLGDGGMGVV